jgi:hypothetical protein
MRKLFLLPLLFIQPANAGDEVKEDRKIIYKQKTEIDFESLSVEGILLKPSSALVLERKHAEFNPLIRLRASFSEEIEQSVNEIK